MTSILELKHNRLAKKIEEGESKKKELAAEKKTLMIDKRTVVRRFGGLSGLKNITRTE